MNSDANNNDSLGRKVSLPYLPLDTIESGGTRLNPGERSNITDKVPTLTEMFYAGGSFSGSIVGGALYDWHGYSFTCTVVAIVSIVFAIIYALVVFVPECGQNEKNLGNDRMKKL